MSAKVKTELTAERLRELLSYDPATGQFIRKATSRTDQIGSVAYTAHTSGYSRFSVGHKKYYAHRLAWMYVYGVWPGGDVDHINHDKTDNRISNLRDVSRSVNNQNQIRGQRGGSSNVLGVSWDKRLKKWAASIGVFKKNIHLGMFDAKEDAHAAYVIAKRELHIGCTI